MWVREHISGQFDIGYENNFDQDEYSQCSEELEFENTNYQKLI